MKLVTCKYLLSYVLVMFLSSTAFADVSVYRPAISLDPTLVSTASEQHRLGDDAKALFAYVRDDIRYTPYVGVMQGGRGALLTRSGNAADQALLLLALLETAEHEVRLVRGSLSPEQTRTLLNSAFSFSFPNEANNDATSSWLDDLSAEVGRQLNMIMSAMSEDNAISLPLNAQADLAQRVLKASEDHWWVQLKLGETWLNLDPSFSTAEFGKAYGSNARPYDRIPENLYHSLTLTVKVKEKIGDQIETRTLLNEVLLTESLMGNTLFLTHQTSGWQAPGTASDLASGALDALVGRDLDNFIPVLSLGKKEWIGAGFYAEGKKGNATGLFALEAALSEDTLPIVEWVDLSLSTPLGVETSRYEIFDRTYFGTATAESGDLGMDHPARILLCFSLSAGPVLHPNAYVSNDETTQKHVGPVNDTYDDVSLAMQSVSHAVATVSDRLLQPFEDDELGRVVYSPLSPRIVVLDTRHQDDKTSFSIDLRHTQYLPWADTETLKKNRFLLQVLKGVVDGTVESHLANLLFSTLEEDGFSHSLSTVDVFHRTEKALLLKNETALATIAGHSKEAQARVMADLDAGQWVVIPENAINMNGNQRTAWWRIDPSSGKTIGVTENGLHGAFTEYKIMIDRNTLATRAIWVKRAGRAYWTRLGRVDWGWVHANRHYLRLVGLLTVHVVG